MVYSDLVYHSLSSSGGLVKYPHKQNVQSMQNISVVAWGTWSHGHLCRGDGENCQPWSRSWGSSFPRPGWAVFVFQRLGPFFVAEGPWDPPAPGRCYCWWDWAQAWHEQQQPGPICHLDHDKQSNHPTSPTTPTIFRDSLVLSITGFLARQCWLVTPRFSLRAHICHIYHRLYPWG